MCAVRLVARETNHFVVKLKQKRPVHLVGGETANEPVEVHRFQQLTDCDNVHLENRILVQLISQQPSVIAAGAAATTNIARMP
jgi:hypothetical protein